MTTISLKKQLVIGVFAFVIVLAPSVTRADYQVQGYESLSINEKIIYLQGRVVQLMAILAIMENEPIKGNSSSGSRTSRNNDFSLVLSDVSVDKGDVIEIDWELKSRDKGSRNWIGLYERGDSNKEYIQWKYLKSDTDGTVSFTMNREGSFEFRLFLDNSYDDEITSKRISVD